MERSLLKNFPFIFTRRVNFTLQQLCYNAFHYFSQGGDDKDAQHIRGGIESEKGVWNAGGPCSQLLLPQLWVRTMGIPCLSKRLWVCLWCLWGIMRNGLVASLFCVCFCSPSLFGPVACRRCINCGALPDDFLASIELNGGGSGLAGIEICHHYLLLCLCKVAR